MHNLLTFGDLSDFLRKLINNKAVIRIYNDEGYAEEITIVGMITIKNYPDVLVQYVGVEDEDVDDALKKYISCGYISNLFANGFDIFKDDQYYYEDNEDDEEQYCFDPRECDEDEDEEDCNCDCDCDCDCECTCEEKSESKANAKTAKQELEELEDAIAELMAAIFDPLNYTDKKRKDK